jgi:hypothetical protein
MNDKQPDYSQFDKMTPLQLIHALDKWQKRKDAVDAEAAEVTRIFDHLRITRIPAAFDDAGIENMTVEGVGRCSITADLHARILPGQQDEAFTWLRDNGRGDLIKETVNSGSLRATCKQMLRSGEKVPDMIEVSPYQRASITRAGVK